MRGWPAPGCFRAPAYRGDVRSRTTYRGHEDPGHHVRLLGAVAAAACGKNPSADRPSAADPVTTEAADWTTYEVPDAGLTISFPSSWKRATGQLMPMLADPRELVALGTSELRPGGENCAHMPENAVEEMGPTDAFVVVEERLAEASARVPAQRGIPNARSTSARTTAMRARQSTASTGRRSSSTVSFRSAMRDGASMRTSRSGTSVARDSRGGLGDPRRPGHRAAGLGVDRAPGSSISADQDQGQGVAPVVPTPPVMAELGRKTCHIRPAWVRVVEKVAKLPGSLHEVVVLAQGQSFPTPSP